MRRTLITQGVAQCRHGPPRPLTSLDLGDNRIGDQGAERLAAALERNITLTSLNLGFNGIGAQMAERLAGALDLNRGGIRVMTVNCSKASAPDSNVCRIMFTDIGGSEVATMDVMKETKIGTLTRQLVAQSKHRGHWRFVLPNGNLLKDLDMVSIEWLNASMGDQAPQAEDEEEESVHERPSKLSRTV